MLGHFKNKTVGAVLNFKGIKNRREFTLKLHVDDGTNDLGNFTLGSDFSSTEGTYNLKNNVRLRLCLVVKATYVWRDVC